MMIKKGHRFINGTMFLIQYCLPENQEHCKTNIMSTKKKQLQTFFRNISLELQFSTLF